MPPIFTKFLARQLSNKLQLEVKEASFGTLVAPGQVLIAPGGQHMAVAREGDTVRVVINQDPPENSCRPAADVLLRSVAAAYGRRALAVILTGMGKDGLRGCEAVRERGGQVIAQDRGSSVVWGMPGFVVSSGLADAVLPLDRVGAEIVKRVAAGAGGRRRSRVGPGARA
jgi:two-component system chemotaxis response regulator CheB